MLLTHELCRAGRALLNWAPDELASAAGIDVQTLIRFEAGAAVELQPVEAIFEALTGAGLEFIPAGGKSLRGGIGVGMTPAPEPEVALAEQAIELGDADVNV